MASQICYLKSVKNVAKRINLPHGKPVMIGRNEECEIQDLHVSRKHLECTADVTTSQVSVKTLGKCFSGCNGYALVKGETYSLKHGDIVEVRLGDHAFEIIFESPDEDVEPPRKKQVTDFFNMKPKAEDGLEGKWERIEGNALLIFTPDSCTSQPDIAAFDVDGTIIKTKSGARFPKDDTDWVFNIKNVPQKLQLLHDSNYKIVFFTNQSGLGTDPSKIQGFKKKIETIITKIGIPIQAFIATRRSIYRKPAPGMWNTLVNHKNDNVAVSLDKSFYVGDAAGREKNWAPKKNKDHSICDRLFALNIGLKFYTPEEYFLKSASVKHIMPEFDPRNLPDCTYPIIQTDKQEVAIMVGGPGSGKSHFCKSQLVPKGYVHVSRDVLGSWQKCSKMLEKNLQEGKNVVIDNTNQDKVSRQRYVEVARKNQVPIRCFLMTSTFKHTRHNNRFREMTDEGHEAIGEMILHSFQKHYQEPELSEGFSEIVKVPFVCRFDNPEHEKLYKMFLLED